MPFTGETNQLSLSELRAPVSGNAGIHIQAVRVLLSSIYTEDGI